MERTGSTNQELMAKLCGHPGFDSIKDTLVEDKNAKSIKHVHKVNFDIEDVFQWLVDPPVDPSAAHPMQQVPDTFGLWDKDYKRPAVDRNFLPRKGASTDVKDSAFATAPAHVCINPENGKAFFEGKPLVRTDKNSKILELEGPIFDFPQGNPNKMLFKELPFWALSEAHNRTGLGTQAAMRHVVSDMSEYSQWITNNWNNKIDIGSFKADPPVPHADTISDQILKDPAFGKKFLLETFSNLQSGLELVKNGLTSTCELTGATIVAARNEGRTVVLDNCTQNPKANYKEALNNTPYGHKSLFGPLPPSFLSAVQQDAYFKGRVSVKTKVTEGSATKNFSAKPNNYGNDQVPTVGWSGPRGRGSRRNHSFRLRARGRGRGAIQYKASSHKQPNPAPKKEAKNAKRGKFSKK